MDVGSFVRAFVSGIPRRGQRGYRRPGVGDLAVMGEAFEMLRRGEAEPAARLGERYRYEVRELVVPQGRVLAMAERPRLGGTWANAWGLYLVAPEARSSLVIEVPHPLHDEHTELVGTELFERTGARYLFVAGAHRFATRDGAADMAHQEASVFESLHRMVAKEGGPVVQLHGYAASTRPPGYGDAVLSSGTPVPGRSTLGAAAALSAEGVEVSVYDGREIRTLGGATNVQAASSLAAGTPFLHVELSDRVRSNPDLRRRVVSALAAAMG